MNPKSGGQTRDPLQSSCFPCHGASPRRLHTVWKLFCVRAAASRIQARYVPSSFPVPLCMLAPPFSSPSRVRTQQSCWRLVLPHFDSCHALVFLPVEYCSVAWFDHDDNPNGRKIRARTICFATSPPFCNAIAPTMAYSVSRRTVSMPEAWRSCVCSGSHVSRNVSSHFVHYNSSRFQLVLCQTPINAKERRV